jgi:hypothetical protein
MRTNYLSWSAALIVGAIALFNQTAAAGKVRSAVNWADFLARQDLVWETLP